MFQFFIFIFNLFRFKTKQYNLKEGKLCWNQGRTFLILRFYHFETGQPTPNLDEQRSTYKLEVIYQHHQESFRGLQDSTEH